MSRVFFVKQEEPKDGQPQVQQGLPLPQKIGLLLGACRILDTQKENF